MSKQSRFSTKSITLSSVAIIVLATVFISYTTGYYVADKKIADTTHGHADDGGEKVHEHPKRNVQASSAPAIKNLAVTPDNKSGWNISFDTENFTFAPGQAGNAHQNGQGHAHLYIDGKKITRLYTTYHYIGELSEGKHTIRITLNTNDHQDYAVDGTTIQTEAVITDNHHSTDNQQHNH
jgi:hypothetical protein